MIVSAIILFEHILIQQGSHANGVIVSGGANVTDL
jgi:hypothetical protein